MRDTRGFVGEMSGGNNLNENENAFIKDETEDALIVDINPAFANKDATTERELPREDTPTRELTVTEDLSVGDGLKTVALSAKMERRADMKGVDVFVDEFIDRSRIAKSTFRGIIKAFDIGNNQAAKERMVGFMDWWRENVGRADVVDDINEKLQSDTISNSDIADLVKTISAELLSDLKNKSQKLVDSSDGHYAEIIQRCEDVIKRDTVELVNEINKSNTVDIPTRPLDGSIEPLS